MNLTNDHNNLTKLSEKISCTYGKIFQTCNSYGIGWEFHIIEELYFIFIIFGKINTSDIKHHVGEDYSNYTQPYHSPQQLGVGSAFCYPQVSSLRIEHLATKLKTR